MFEENNTDIIERNPNMQLIAIDGNYRFDKQYLACKNSVFYGCMAVIQSITAQILIFVGHWQTFALCLVGSSVICGIACCIYAHKEKKLGRKMARLKPYATHVEYYVGKGRMMRRIYKNGKLGLVWDKDFSVEIKPSCDTIEYVFDGQYRIIDEPGGIPYVFDEEREKR